MSIEILRRRRQLLVLGAPSLRPPSVHGGQILLWRDGIARNVSPSRSELEDTAYHFEVLLCCKRRWATASNQMDHENEGREEVNQ